VSLIQSQLKFTGFDFYKFFFKSLWFFFFFYMMCQLCLSCINAISKKLNHKRESKIPFIVHVFSADALARYGYDCASESALKNKTN